MNRFEGKVAFVTGGASGIGLQIVKQLAHEGAKVVMGDVQEEQGRNTAQEVGDSVTFCRVDVGDEGVVKSAIEFTEAKFGRLDLAVNAAGVQGQLGALADLDPSAVEHVFRVNALGVFHCCKYEVLAMRKHGGGAIVNIASSSGICPIPFMGAYSASKSAVMTLTSMAANEEGPAGIRVNAIAPGFTDTPMLGPDVDRSWPTSTLPTRRMGYPRHIAEATAFLLSDAAEQITGITMPVDGGLCTMNVLSAK
ncbi:putative secondary metabolism biosynthetic enzyme [Rhinocladiella similis]